MTPREKSQSDVPAASPAADLWVESEEFDRIAYAYRSWPGHDSAGVLARFEELKAAIKLRALLLAGPIQQDTK